MADPTASVHPHVRGEDAKIPLAYRAGGGSPPRAWGRFQTAQRSRLNGRFTPTCVGKMCARHPTAPRNCGSPPRAWGRFRAGGKDSEKQTVHPHVRGEDGKFDERNHARTRFTPTCVGKILVQTSFTQSAAVHPHVRGEDQKQGRRRAYCRGSPPRAWGRCIASSNSPAHRRFTPTCVGKISRSTSCNYCPTVHPHVRGEDAASDSAVPLHIEVHPHVRGEDLIVPRNRCHPCGSPPRAWGR